MLVFIISLKSPQVSSSWNRVCELFERTLRSVCNQTSSKFRVIVVCHELPKIKFEHPHINYLQVTFPVPNKGYLSKNKDKMHKMLVGLIEAKTFNLSHIMFVDADDCVSKHLAEFVVRNNNSNGWFFNQGYEYREDIKLLKIRNNNFHLRTNTSHIIKYNLFKETLNMDISDITEDCILNHINTIKILKSRMIILEPLPFRGTVYITDNGENIWWSQAKINSKRYNVFNLKSMIYSLTKEIYQITITRPISISIRNEFSI